MSTSFNGIICSIGDEEKMNHILEIYPEKSIPVYLFQTVIYYRLTNYPKAKSALRSLYHLVPEFKQLINGDMDEEDFMEQMLGEYYKPYSLEEILLLLSEHKCAFSNENLIFWMQSEINKMK